MLKASLQLLALSAFATALPTLSKKDTICGAPDSFSISQFSVFTPSAGNTHPTNLVFEVLAPVGATCQSTIISNPTTPIVCADSDYQYEWDPSSSTLTLGQTYTPCNTTDTALAVGSTYISLDCIPAEVPFGDGTNCEEVVVQVGGHFTRSTW